MPLIPIQLQAELGTENRDAEECVGSCLELRTEQRPGRSLPGSCQFRPLLALLNKRVLRCCRADNLLALTGQVTTLNPHLSQVQCLTYSQPCPGNLHYADTAWEDKEKGNTVTSTEAAALWARSWVRITSAKNKTSLFFSFALS